MANMHVYAQDAYLGYIGAMEVSLHRLREAKFVHHSMISHPAQYEALVFTLRASLDSLDSIVLKRGRSSPTSSHNVSNINHNHRAASPTLDKKRNIGISSNFQHGKQPRPSTDEVDEIQSIGSDHSSLTKSPPLIPPKPSRMQKPTVAPKPLWKPPRSNSPANTQPPAGSDDTTSSLSPPFASNNATSNTAPPIPKEPTIKRPVPLPPAISTSTSTSTAASNLKLPSAIAKSSVKQRPRASSVSFADQYVESSEESEPQQPTTPTHVIDDDDDDDDLDEEVDFGLSEEISTIRIVGEGHVDPTDLVPAQTNPGDSLAPPSSFGDQPTDYVPNIPVPPLLTTYRQIQEKLNKVDGKLSKLKTQKQRMLRNDEVAYSPDSDEEDIQIYTTEESINQAIFEYTSLTAETKDTLNKVRTLYMSAATVPNVTQFPAHLIAYQLTLIESAIFAEIPPESLLTHSARSPHPRIVASTDFFNYTTRFIEHSILLQQEAAHRAEHVHLWVKVAGKCLALNNYQTLKAIVSALGTPPVQRLKRTWACIPKKSLSKLETLGQLMSEANNYGNYREHMGMVNTSGEDRSSAISIKPVHILKPTVPFLGTFIHDMTYLLAAVKSLPDPKEDPRIQGILLFMHQFQSGPKYPEIPPSAYIKLSQKHSFRPASITSALHRSSSSKTRMSNSVFFGGSNGSVVDDFDMGKEIEIQQQIITQYLLMRPWVSEKNVDDLSLLREPPKQRRGSSPGHARTRSGTGSGTYSSSGLSTNGSISRFSTGNLSANTTASGSGSDSRPTSTEESNSHISEEASPTATEGKQRGSFWSFTNPLRKTSDASRSHLGSVVSRRSVSDLRTSVPESVGENDEYEKENNIDEDVDKLMPPAKPEANLRPASDGSVWKDVADQAIRQQAKAYPSKDALGITPSTAKTFTPPKPPSVPKVPPRQIHELSPPKPPIRPLAQPPSIPSRQINAISAHTRSTEDELKAALAKRYTSEN
ncbi:hypothetical protein NQZ79_g6194 [Umbelopsis isabellina]|nr:hypothetical protein NQZ79_g6194 [Umbelopsis isabellina]